MTTYYDREDEPDMSKPETALDMWNSQRGMLETTLNDAMAFVEEAGQQLGRLYHFAEANKLDEQKESVMATWQHVQGLQNIIHQQQAAHDGASSAIEAILRQRDDIASEMQDLVKAIEEGNEAHPKLRQYAEDIREHESEMQESYMYEVYAESADEEAAYRVMDNIASTLSHLYDDVTAEWYSHQIYDLLDGTEPTPEQAKLLRALCETFVMSEQVRRRLAQSRED